MSKRPFTDFRRVQVTFEIRYPEAYLLWDRAGRLWSGAQKIFSSLSLQNAVPNNTTFNADKRYSISVNLDRAFIIDNKAEKTTDQLSDFVDLVIGTLELGSLDRVGTRIQYALDCKDKSEAASVIRGYGLANDSPLKLFDVEPHSLVPGYRLEGTDDQLGYLFQLAYRLRKVEFSVGAEVADLEFKSLDREIDQVIADVDLFTTVPTSTASFQSASWMQRCLRIAGRDISGLLS